MSEFEKMRPALTKLFMRLDAASPTDPMLQATAEVWRERRGNALLPAASLLQDLPDFIRPHAFLARHTADGQRKWMFSDAGPSARLSLGAQAGPMAEAATPALAQRLEALFDLVAEKGEPCAGMFELQSKSGQSELYEVYAAPVASTGRGETALLAALHWRTEAIK